MTLQALNIASLAIYRTEPETLDQKRQRIDSQWSDALSKWQASDEGTAGYEASAAS